MNERPILVSSADRRYAMPLAVMLRSAAENCRAEAGLDIRVLDGGLGRRVRRRVLRSLPSGRVMVSFIDVRRASRKLRGAPVFGHISLATYYRFLIADLVPEPKAIYVDADAVVLGDLTELWREPVGGSHLLGVQAGTVTSATPIAGLEERGIPSNHPRLSAGVLVMNLCKWRKENPVPALMGYLAKYGKNLRFWDQDALNIVLARKWGLVPAHWNYLVDCSHSVSESSTDAVARLRQDARIVHYASATKPWDYYADHAGKALFYEYLDRTAWRGWRPRPPLRVLLNPHWWGAIVRRVPLLGHAWMRLRSTP